MYFFIIFILFYEVEKSCRFFSIPSSKFLVHIPEKCFPSRESSYERNLATDNTHICKIEKIPEVISWNPVKINGSWNFLFSTNLENDSIPIARKIKILKSSLISKNWNPDFILEILFEIHVGKPVSSCYFCLWIMPDSSVFEEGRVGEFDYFSFLGRAYVFFEMYLRIPWIK